MRTSVAVLFASMLASALTPGSLAQVITTPPGAPAPLPEYVPPAPPPPPPAPAPVEPPPAAPDLIKRAADGSLIALTTPPEFAAVRGLKIDAATLAKFEAFVTDRQAKIDAAVVANPVKAAEFYSSISNLDKIEQNALMKFPETLRLFQVQPTQLVDAIRGAGVLSQPQLDAAASAATAYRAAMAEDVKKASGGDMTQVVLLTSRRQVGLVSTEFKNAMDRLLGAIAKDWGNASAVVAWPNESELKAAMAGSDEAAKHAAIASGIKSLDPALAGKLLGKYALPVPAPVTPPATPGTTK